MRRSHVQYNWYSRSAKYSKADGSGPLGSHRRSRSRRCDRHTRTRSPHRCAGQVPDAWPRRFHVHIADRADLALYLAGGVTTAVHVGGWGHGARAMVHSRRAAKRASAASGSSVPGATSGLSRSLRADDPCRTGRTPGRRSSTEPRSHRSRASDACTRPFPAASHS